MRRCAWAKTNLMKEYHDKEWGKPVHNDAMLFELLVLETMQAGLSWETVLKKRENYRRALDNFDPECIQNYTSEKQAQLLENSGIIRNRLKVNSIVVNAKAFIEVQKEWGSFDCYLWSFVDGNPIDHQIKDESEVPAQNELSQKLSKALKKKGFSFVGPTVCYAYMQAAGLINDHHVECAFK
ncbi:DNA-3-methyladenine glycosylase I [Desemzia sp. RIT804]|uniref:DNA-3-methyladenine glycosylase I n=1 Tax=Desemzia sp. RIT 804 TaxID=2810209 RepID=UPI0019517E57|nr:DNA-3-methyladenine glycosylase I [Desemzia sp. RIT 804]MBM6613345.1 DNA-3-methyladenine glycosylase I [Desemzia sp. RIT 804]